MTYDACKTKEEKIKILEKLRDSDLIKNEMNFDPIQP